MGKSSKPEKIPKLKYKHKPIRRGKHKNKINNSFTILGANANGLKAKTTSLNNIISNSNVSCFMIQESKFTAKGQFKVDGFQIFERIRKSEDGGGGIVTGVANKLNPVLISEGQENVELLVVECEVNNNPIRIINGYGPQETDPDKLEFFISIEEEIEKAKDDGKSVIIEMDANSKLGSEIIRGDPHTMSKNGELLKGIIDRQNLTVVNSLDLCEGIITRKRVTTERTELSVIDFILVCERMLPLVKKMVVDEARENVLTKFTTRKGVKISKVESDHNSLFCEFNIPVGSKKPINERKEVFNFRNKECQVKFKKETDHGTQLSDCFKGEDDILSKSEKFLKGLNKKFQNSFKKYRVTKKKKVTETEKKINQKRECMQALKSENDISTKKILNKKMEQLDEELANMCAKENSEKIKEQVKKYSNFDGTFCSQGMWEVRKAVLPRPRDPPMAKKDKAGNLVTDPGCIKNLYLDCYTDRLRYRDIAPGLENLRDLKEELWERRSELLEEVKSDDWSMEELEKVLGSLKINKSRDPHGLINELFKPSVAGTDLKCALLKLMNGIKKENKVPDFMKTANITTIYKNKGEKTDLSNDRGVFVLSCFRTILDKLIYFDSYETIDSAMSDSNVGARKGRNIRNHLFIINGVMNSVKQGEAEPVDIQLYDIKQCFDSMWPAETMNDLYEVSPKNDKLSILSKSNRNVKIAVNTPFGLTKRKTLKSLEMQGSQYGPIKCSAQIDQIGSESMQKNQNLYNYKQGPKGPGVSLPCLSMIDDILAFALCGNPSTKINNYINSKIQMKKLWFNDKKCKKIHIGKESIVCPELKVHGCLMEESKTEKYLGDLLSCDCTNSKNIHSKKGKAMGIVVQIMRILKEVSLGEHYFKIALLLREALFVNGILTNLEVSYGLTKKEISELEAVDKTLLRNILGAHSKTPIEAFYLELGCFPLSEIIKYRRIMFLHYILSRPKEELLHKFFLAQADSPVKNDWILTVKINLQEFNMDMSFEDIKKLSKEAFSQIVKAKLNKFTLERLLNIKETHSKMENLKYSELNLQPYLKSDKISVRIAKQLFRYRTKMADLKDNFRSMYVDNNLCPLECGQPDTQENLLTCSSISENFGTAEYNDLFTSNVDKNKVVIEALIKSMERRDQILEKQDQD